MSRRAALSDNTIRQMKLRRAVARRRKSLPALGIGSPPPPLPPPREEERAKFLSAYLSDSGI